MSGVSGRSLRKGPANLHPTAAARAGGGGGSGMAPTVRSLDWFDSQATVPGWAVKLQMDPASVSWSTPRDCVLLRTQVHSIRLHKTEQVSFSLYIDAMNKTKKQCHIQPALHLAALHLLHSTIERFNPLSRKVQEIVR